MTTLLVTSIGAGALMGFAHYGLPRLLKRTDIHPLLRFTFGVGFGILLPLWSLPGDLLGMDDILTVCVGAGMGTALAYLLDWWGGYHRGE